MSGSIFAMQPTFLPLVTPTKRVNSQFPVISPNRVSVLKKNGRSIIRVTEALNEVSSAAGVADSYPEITWQIIIGALAGVTPFIVAGIEFNKRIVAQKQCTVCKGSGLVLRDNKYYFRCPNCGGFLPWQSWKRFFSG